MQFLKKPKTVFFSFLAVLTIGFILKNTIWMANAEQSQGKFTQHTQPLRHDVTVSVYHQETNSFESTAISSMPEPILLAQFDAELADEAHERSKGLMHRDSLASDSGMLFLYPSPQNVSFWMRNTLISLDMLFVAEDCRIIRIEHSAQPLTDTPRASGGAIVAVLEISGGTALEQGINIGDCVRWQENSV